MRRYMPPVLAALVVTCAEPFAPRYDDAAIATPPASLSEPPDVPIPLVIGSVTYRAEPWILEPGVLRIEASAFDRNASRRLDLGGGDCVVELRVFDSPARTAPRWTAPPRPGRCPPQEHGQTFRTFAMAAILGDSLPPGTYSVETRLHVEGAVLSIVGGAVYLHPDRREPVRAFEHLRVHAAMAVEEVAPRVLTVQLGLENPLDRSTRIEYGACAVVLRAHRKADYSDPPAWRSEYGGDPRFPTIGRACIAILYSSLIQPGEVLRAPAFRLQVPVYEILADSLREGTYYIAAELTVLHDTVRTMGGNVYADQRPHRYAATLGAVRLERQEPPLPTERVRHGFRYSAASTVTRDTAQIVVTVTNVTERLLPLQIALQCALQPVYWSSAAARDRVPPAQPAWVSANSCRLEYTTVLVAPGESKSYGTTVPLAALRAAIRAHAHTAASTSSVRAQCCCPRVTWSFADARAANPRCRAVRDGADGPRRVAAECGAHAVRYSCGSRLDTGRSTRH